MHRYGPRRSVKPPNPARLLSCLCIPNRYRDLAGTTNNRLGDNQMELMLNYEDASVPGVYGFSANEAFYYIGQSKNVYSRTTHHIKTILKDFNGPWECHLLYFSKDPTDRVNYENRFIRHFRDLGHPLVNQYGVNHFHLDAFNRKHLPFSELELQDIEVKTVYSYYDYLNYKKEKIVEEKYRAVSSAQMVGARKLRRLNRMAKAEAIKEKMRLDFEARKVIAELDLEPISDHPKCQTPEMYEYQIEDIMRKIAVRSRWSLATFKFQKT